MAAKKVTRRRRAYSAVKRTYSRAAGLGGGKMSPIIQGAAGGIAASLANRFLPGYGNVVGMGAVGYFTGNPTLLTLTGMNLAAMIPMGNLLGSGSSNTGGGAI